MATNLENLPMKEAMAGYTDTNQCGCTSVSFSCSVSLYIMLPVIVDAAFLFKIFFSTTL